MDRDDTILAGEFAARLLEGDALASASRKYLSDPSFAEMVAWWELQLAEQHPEFESVVPPSDLWAAIKARLSRHRATPEVSPVMSSPQDRPASRWRNVAALLAVGCLAMLVLGIQLGEQRTPSFQEPTEPVAVNETQLIALLDGGDEGPTIAARIDPASSSLNVSTSGADPTALGDERAPVLWVISEGGAPTSLGMLPAEGVSARSLTPAERSLIEEGATLAVTYEIRSDAPHAAPQGDILATGQLRGV